MKIIKLNWLTWISKWNSLKSILPMNRRCSRYCMRLPRKIWPKRTIEDGNFSCVCAFKYIGSLFPTDNALLARCWIHLLLWVFLRLWLCVCVNVCVSVCVCLCVNLISFSFSDWSFSFLVIFSRQNLQRFLLINFNEF